MSGTGCARRPPPTKDSSVGAWTEMGKCTSLTAATMGDYSCITADGHVVWTTIGKFCSIAGGARINPGRHPTWRAVPRRD